MQGMMTYEEARNYIMEAKTRGIVMGLDTMRNLMARLGNVQDGIPVVHITGTNGKGSVGAYLYSIFHEAGITVGRYYSPAVFDPLEVWQYEGEQITKREYARMMTRVKAACDQMEAEGLALPTSFEIETAIAFLYFYEKKPGVALIEVGMGGAQDATNVVSHPIATIFTRISLDHVKQLGSTIEEIAREKIGIIKEGCSVYSAPQEPVVEQMIRDRAEELGCHIGVVKANKIKLIHMEPGDLRFLYKDITMHTTMGGLCQMENAAVATKAAFHTLPKLLYENDYMSVRRIARASVGIELAHWPGRYEVIDRDPLFIIDGAHNEDAAKQLADTLDQCFPNQRITYIMGVLADKDFRGILRQMQPHAGKMYTVTPDNPRALDGKVLAEEAREQGIDAVALTSVNAAVRKAISLGEPVLAFGTLSYLGKVRACVEKNRRE